MTFTDRVEAGKQLAKKLARFHGKAVIFALPRGGVVLGAEVSRELEAPLDLILVRKISHPGYEEYAVGAVAEGNKPIFNEAEKSFIDSEQLQRMVAEKQKENERRRSEYFPKNYHHQDLRDKVAIIVDDGIATGLTMMAAAEAIKKRGPKKIVVAVPVAPEDSIDEVKNIADEVLVLDDPQNFRGAVGSHYRNFPQVEDQEVIDILSDEEDEQ